MARAAPGKKSKETPARPAPLTPPGCDMSGYPGFQMHVTRLKQSDFDATNDDTAWRAGLNLWFASWLSVPAGSLRPDDASLAKAADLGRDLATWLRVKPTALSGFVECSDGRLYHAVVCEQALSVWIDKLIRRHAGARGNRGDRAPEARAAEIRNIEQQIVAAGACLRALNPMASALSKVGRVEAQSTPQCGAENSALRPQYNGSEGNGSKSKGPIQEGAEVIHIAEARA